MVFFSQAFFYVDTQLVKAKNRLQNGNKRKTFFKKTSILFGQTHRNSYFCTRKTEIRYALLAQLVEQLTLNQWVQGSNP